MPSIKQLPSGKWMSVLLREQSVPRGELKGTENNPLMMTMKAELFTAIAVSLIMASSMVEMDVQPVKADQAGSISYSSGVTIFCPVNTTYDSKFLTLNLTFGFGLGVKTTFNYTIDGKYGEDPITFVYKNPTELHIINEATGTVKLPELSVGSHVLQINVLSGIYDYHGANPPSAPFKPSLPGSSNYIASWTHTVYFSVSSSSSPEPTKTPYEAHSSSSIVIKPDGSVVGTNKIQAFGNVYFLLGDLYDSPVIVECNNMVLDGNGFTLQGAGGWPTPAAINLTCTNVTVQNFNILNWEVGILGAWNNNTIANNNITNNERNIAIYADNYDIIGNQIENGDYSIRIIGNNNTIQNNSIKAGAVAFWITSSLGNVITANQITFQNPTLFETDNGGYKVYNNNFISNRNITGFLLNIYGVSNTTILPYSWDNGYPSGGNYWSDYTARYPNATEIDDSGIGNTPYVINDSPRVLDRYPLLKPANLTTPEGKLPTPTPFPSLTIPTSNQSPTMQPSQTPSPSIPELSYCTVAITLVLVTSVFIIRRKLKMKNS